MENFSEITYCSKQVICEKPRIIINPLLPELIAKYHCYSFRGEIRHDRRLHSHYFDFDYRPFSIKRNDVTIQDISSCFVIDEDSGETFPIYVQVPCNSCDVCRQRKINSFVQRCKLETCSYDSKPWFFTLTYDREHLPADGVSKRDIQLFMKRFRINLVRHGYFNRIRYVIVSEYGKLGRAHYHGLFWNIDCYTNKQYLEVSDLFEKSWSNGFIMHRLVNPENDKAFYYTAKYMRKSGNVPSGKNPNFFLSSNGHGGIGSRFIDKIAPELRRTLNVSFKFLNKWTNRVEDLVFSQYVLNRVFPSYHKSVPSDLRRSLQDYSLLYSVFSNLKSKNLFYEQISLQFKKFYDYFAPHTFFGFVSLGEIPRECQPSLDGLTQELCNLGAKIERWYGCINFQDAEEIAKKRDRFIFRLFQYIQPVDIGAIAYKARRNFGLSHAREIL